VVAAGQLGCESIPQHPREPDLHGEQRRQRQRQRQVAGAVARRRRQRPISQGSPGNRATLAPTQVTPRH
jgi:hypothetical protein